MKVLIINSVLLLFILVNAQAQSIRKPVVNNSAWFMYFGDHKLSAKWGIHLEAQLRRNEFVKNGQQSL